jgi:hypothetical protein
VVVVLIIVLVAVIVIVTCVVCRKGADEAEREYVVELSSEPSITPMPYRADSARLSARHPLRDRLLGQSQY